MKDLLDKNYWDKRYDDQTASWDIGKPSRPLKEYIDQITNKDIAVLIPGCGNAHEAKYLLQQGFTNITLIDISPVPVSAIEQKLAAYIGKQLHVICDDFFNLQQKFDLILEQTFFCALDPLLRKDYAAKMYEVLKPGGKLVGVLFNRSFDESPPFGGNKEEYEKLFSEKFQVKTMEQCYNSIEKRKGNELFVILMKI